MSDQIRVEEKELVVENRSSALLKGEDAPPVCQMQGKRWFKGGLAMMICCAAPLLLVGAIMLFGISLGALASGFLSVAALLVCPVGMYLMMRTMTKKE